VTKKVLAHCWSASGITLKWKSQLFQLPSIARLQRKTPDYANWIDR